MLFSSIFFLALVMCVTVTSGDELDVAKVKEHQDKQILEELPHLLAKIISHASSSSSSDKNSSGGDDESIQLLNTLARTLQYNQLYFQQQQQQSVAMQPAPVIPSYASVVQQQQLQYPSSYSNPYATAWAAQQQPQRQPITFTLQPPLSSNTGKKPPKQTKYGSSSSSSTAKSCQKCGVMRKSPRLAMKIANGRNSDAELYPWNVQLTIRGNLANESATLCGATVISRNCLVTAAHCYDDILPQNYAKNTYIKFSGLRLDSSQSKQYAKILKMTKEADSLLDNSLYRQRDDEQEEMEEHAAGVEELAGKTINLAKSGSPTVITLKASHVHLYPDYAPAMTEEEARMLHTTPGPRHDIAIVVFDSPDDEYIQELITPICLPTEGYHLKKGAGCKIMGHGFLSGNGNSIPKVLQEADVVIANNKECRDEVESMTIKSKITSDTVCIRGPVQPCVGDSGGPLLCTGESETSIEGEADVEQIEFDLGKMMKYGKKKRAVGSKGKKKQPMKILEEDDDEQEEEQDEEEQQPAVGKKKLTKKLTAPTSSRKQWYLMGVTSFAVSTDNFDRCGHFRSAVFAKVSNYIPWIRSMCPQCN